MKLSAKILSMLFTVGFLLIAPSLAHAQGGIISGKVLDREGKPAPGMTLQIQRMNRVNAAQKTIAEIFTVKTTKTGTYSYNGLAQGAYQVVLIENGGILMTYGNTDGTTLTLANGREEEVNFDMRKGPAAASVAAVGAAVPTISAADLTKEREELKHAAENKQNRDKSFKAGTEAYNAKNYEEAVKQFQIVVEVDPKQDVAFANLGNSLNALKRYEEAAAAYQKASQLKPTVAAYQNNLGLAYGGLQKMDEAKTAFEAAATIDPTKAGEYLFNEGAMYYNNSDFPKANEAFKKTLAADPNNKGALLQYSISLFGSEATMPQAEPLLQKFLTLNPIPSDADLAKQLIEAIHTQAPTEFKSAAAQKEEKQKADAEAAKAKNKGTTKATTK